jgi:flavodoxin
MNIKVMYHSRSGNTKKVAEAIAKAVGVTAVQIGDNNDFDAADVLFIGDGVYGGKPNIKTEKFIKSLNGEKVKKVAVFGTYGGQTKGLDMMKELLKGQGISVAEEGFGCKGKSWFFLNRSHPDSNDLKAAGDFAKKIAGDK